MSVYGVAQLSIHDRARYERYVSQFMRVLAGFDGRLLAADESPAVLEGAWPYQKVILLEFPDRGSFERWGSSPEYTENRPGSARSHDRLRPPRLRDRFVLKSPGSTSSSLPPCSASWSSCPSW